MGEAIISRRGGSSAPSNPFAAISVTYPQGSTCTCTNGTKTLKANNTIGQFTFYPNAEGEWTIACTDGENDSSAVVDVAHGNVYKVELGYSIQLIVAGVLNENYSATEFTYNSTNGYLQLYCPQPSGSYSSSKTATKTGTISPGIDLTNFKTITVKLRGSRGTVTRLQIKDADGAETMYQVPTTTATEYTLNIADLKGEYTICGRAASAGSQVGNYSSTLYVYDLVIA